MTSKSEEGKFAHRCGTLVITCFLLYSLPSTHNLLFVLSSFVVQSAASLVGVAAAASSIIPICAVD
jgi:hypothetical protein